MEIRGPLYTSLVPTSHDPTRQPAARTTEQNQSQPQPRHANSQQGQTSRTVRPLNETENHDSASTSNRARHRFSNRDVELPHPTQQAISQYEAADQADGHELLNRLDVFV